MSKGQTLSLRQVQGKTRPFFVMVQDHLYEDNVNKAPVMARGRGFAILASVALMMSAAATIGVSHMGGLL